jgi:GWxTD domain-containing protein
LSGWQPGKYLLTVSATDLMTGESDSASVEFYLLPGREILRAFFASRSIDAYDSLDLKAKVNLVSYELSPDQLIILGKLTDVGKENYLKQFWRERDDDLSTPEIPFRDELLQRYRYANQYFSTNVDRTDGWNTDRGRIYMKYGPWERLDDRQSPLVGNPYQIWRYYSLKEGKYFVFYDWSGSFDYRLVHSNVPGEIFNQQWEDFIDSGESGVHPLDL